MNCVILYRINGGSVQGVTFDDGELHVFPNLDAAVGWLDGAPLGRLVESGQADCQVVALDEL